VTKQQEVAYAWLVALRTAMRAGEVLGLTDADIGLDTRVVRLKKHKTLRYTGRPRFVPVRKPAARLLGVLVASAREKKREDLFTVNGDSAGALFYKATRQLGITDMRFHDSRGEALTLLSQKVDVKTLQKISGHTDINTLIDHYYRETPEDIAKRI
jgi:integrase